ncbi:multidrug resistance efflux pump [Breznakia blatticola]|uniref:Multidrug resistance efflux pump n=1 Tax=Breznakia blatticola TaxID=1754012 RepID=A0A4R8A2A6_9FIRM|nr:HlyD family efflux transporter periplasmic adaptor subunit [Breznakia blatticola]TDW24677.1 multidrug resistance efflux pump [Breznakia blatticola]
MKLYNVHDLKFTRFFFDRKPPKYIWITLLVTVLFTSLIAWGSCFLLKPYVVYGQGNIVAKDSHYVTSNVQGAVISIETSEGEYVENGDILFVVSDGKNGSEVEALLEQYNQAKEKLSIMDLYESSLREKVNHLQNHGLQQEYYGKVEYYLLQVKEEQISRKRVEESLYQKNQKLSQEQKTLASISDPMEKEGKQSSVEALQDEVKQLQQELQNIPQSDKLFYQFISELGTQRTQVETQKQELEGNHLLASTNESTYVIRATSEGYVHYLNPMYEGVSIQANGVVASISKDEPNRWVVETYVDANDIAKIKLGDPVFIQLHGLNEHLYPNIPGMVVSIDQGTLQQETSNGQVLVYRMIVMMDYAKVKDTKSFKQLKKSMPVTCKIVYEEESYLDYVLSLLNFTS